LRSRPERKFLFKLALALGIPVGEMLRRMTSSELSEWMAYDSLEPFGERRADLRAGIISSLIFNVNRGKNVKPKSPMDFLLSRDEGE